MICEKFSEVRDGHRPLHKLESVSSDVWEKLKIAPKAQDILCSQRKLH